MSAAFPDNDLDLKEPAQRAWKRLSPADREKAARHAPDYLAAARRFSRLPHRKTYLQDKGWEKFAERAGTMSARQASAVRAAPASPLHVAIEQQVGPDPFALWFAKLELLGIEAGTATVSLPTRFLRSWVAQHYEEKLLAALSMVEPAVRRVSFEVRPSPVPALASTVGGDGQRSTAVCA